MDTRNPASSGHVSNTSDDMLVLSATTGRAFLDKFIEIMADCFEADLVSIGVVQAMENDRICVVAGIFDGNRIDRMVYDACVTPCMEVVTKAKVVIHLADVHKAFPKDEMFVEENIRSYVGMPIRDENGGTIGLVQLSWRRSIEEEEAEQYVDTLEIYLDRLGAEVSNMNTMRVMSALARGPKQIESQSALRLLAEQMQDAFQVRVVFIAECDQLEDSAFRLLAYCQDGEIHQSLEGVCVPYEGSPCFGLLSQEQFLVPTGLAEAYPKQTHFKDQNLNSYLGIRVDDDNGQPIGHFAIQNDRELATRQVQAELFQLFQDRITLEMKRHKAEQRSLWLEQQVREMVESQD